MIRRRAISPGVARARARAARRFIAELTREDLAVFLPEVAARRAFGEIDGVAGAEISETVDGELRADLAVVRLSRRLSDEIVDVARAVERETGRTLDVHGREATHRPDPDNEPEVRAALADAEEGRLLSPEESEAYVRRLEKGER